MEVQRRLRKVARQAHTRAVHAVENAVASRSSAVEVRRLADILKCRADELRVIDDALIAEEPEESLESEYEAICNYRDCAISARSLADSYITDLQSEIASSIASAAAHSASSSAVILPKLSLP